MDHGSLNMSRTEKLKEHKMCALRRPFMWFIPKIEFEKHFRWKIQIFQFFGHNVLITRLRVFGPRLWFWALMIPHQLILTFFKSDCNFWRHGLKQKNTFCSTQPEHWAKFYQNNVTAHWLILGYVHVNFENSIFNRLWAFKSYDKSCIYKTL